jgi:hypothetical protein
MKVSVEFGHTYPSDGLHTAHMPNKGAELSRSSSAFELAQRQCGEDSVRIAVEQGYEPVKHVMIDDVESYRQGNSADSWKYVLVKERIVEATRQIYAPDEIIRESQFVTQALAHLPKIDGLDPPKKHIKLHTKTGKQRVRIRGFKDVADPEHPSCDVLDLAWHEHRARSAGVLLTILHYSYEDQQARVHALMDLTDAQQSSSATLFLDDSGAPIQLIRWNVLDERANLYFDALESLTL